MSGIHKVTFTNEDIGTPPRIRISFTLPLQTVEVDNVGPRELILAKFSKAIRNARIETKDTQHILRSFAETLIALASEMEAIQKDFKVHTGGAPEPIIQESPDNDLNYGSDDAGD